MATQNYKPSMKSTRESSQHTTQREPTNCARNQRRQDKDRVACELRVEAAALVDDVKHEVVHDKTLDFIDTHDKPEGVVPCHMPIITPRSLHGIVKT